MQFHRVLLQPLPYEYDHHLHKNPLEAVMTSSSTKEDNRLDTILSLNKSSGDGTFARTLSYFI